MLFQLNNVRLRFFSEFNLFEFRQLEISNREISNNLKYPTETFQTTWNVQPKDFKQLEISNRKISDNLKYPTEISDNLKYPTEISDNLKYPPERFQKTWNTQPRDFRQLEISNREISDSTWKQQTEWENNFAAKRKKRFYLSFTPLKEKSYYYFYS